MSRHIEKAMELRNATPMTTNCAQTIMSCYAEKLGLTQEQACALGCNFGGGMKCGETCGAITSALMVLGAKGVVDPATLGSFRRAIAEKHGGLTNCAELLRANAERGGEKKAHCDGMIKEAIELIDEIC